MHNKLPPANCRRHKGKLVRIQDSATARHKTLAGYEYGPLGEARHTYGNVTLPAMRP